MKTKSISCFVECNHCGIDYNVTQVAMSFLNGAFRCIEMNAPTSVAMGNVNLARVALSGYCERCVFSVQGIKPPSRFK